MPWEKGAFCGWTTTFRTRFYSRVYSERDCISCERSPSQRRRAMRHLVFLVAVSSFLAIPVSAEPPTILELYGKPFRAVYNKFGAAKCDSLVSGVNSEPLTLDYDPPQGGIAPSKSGFINIPASSFSINGQPCNRSDSFISHPVNQPPARNASDVTTWDFLIEYLATLQVLEFMYVGNASPDTESSVATLKEAQCVFSTRKRASDGSRPGSFGTSAIRVRDLAALRITEGFKFPSPGDATLVLDARPNLTYIGLHLDILRVPDGSGTLCLLEKVDSKNGSDNNATGGEMKLSTGQVVGIAVGALGLALLVGGVITGVHCWQIRKSRQPPTTDGRPVDYRTPDGRILQVFVDAD